MGSSSRPRRTEPELEHAAAHVAHEVLMLCFAADSNPSTMSSPPEPALDFVALESFLLHYRNVRDFLFPRSSIKNPDPKSKFYPQALDTVLAVDFNQGWQNEDKHWIEIVPNERERINKQLSHISYSRLPEGPKWPMPKMKVAMVEVFKEFLRGLPPERKAHFWRLKSWFPDILW